MKNSILTLILICLSSALYSQNLTYEIRGKYKHSVKMDKVDSANSLSDFIEGYPSSWVKDYETVEIIATLNGITKKAIGKSEILNQEQKALLRSVELFTTLDINISHTTSNAATGKQELRVIKYSMTVVPDIEAHFVGGVEQMNKYVESAAINKISAFTAEYILDGVVTFTVGEDGSVKSASLTKSTGDATTDKLLLNAIKNMPKWNPAVDANGKKIRQDFELRVSKGGC